MSDLSNKDRYTVISSTLLKTKRRISDLTEVGGLFQGGEFNVTLADTPASTGAIIIDHSDFTSCPQKTSTFLFLTFFQKLTNFNYFCVKSWENLTREFLHICSLYLQKIQKKVIFDSITHTIFWLFTLPHEKTNCNLLTHPTRKCDHTNLWTAKLLHLNSVFIFRQ